MDSILNITNGDSAVDIMHQAGLPGHFLPWRDVLHDGPVPENLNNTELAGVRAKFIAAMGWAKESDVFESFVQRDQLLEQGQQFDKVLLWFEHDLYDQLQILQILDGLSRVDLQSTELSMVCTDNYLGYRTPEDIAELLEFESPITTDQIELSCKAWLAFRSPTPELWNDLINHDTNALLFLEGAVIRLLQEYPDHQSGLSRTASSCLELIANNEFHPGRLFRAYQDTEERRFMGDLSFWKVLEEMLQSDYPLIALPHGKRELNPGDFSDVLKLTDLGQEVLSGKVNWLEKHTIDKWIGGVRLTQDNIWYWNSKNNLIQR